MTPTGQGRKPLIVAENMTAGYELERERKLLTALEGVSLTVHDGEFLVLVGPSGCGKTTFINVIAGLVQPWSGSVTFNGKPIDGPGEDRSMVFQDYAIMPWRTVEQNIQLPFELRPHDLSKSDVADKVQAIIGDVGLTGFEKSFPYELSGGMRQRVGLARAMVTQPKVLLADEPFGAVDAMTREVLQAQLEALVMNAGQTVVFITHSIDEAIALGDRIAVISNRPGKVREIVTVDMDRPRLAEGEITTHPRYGELREHLWNLVKDEALGAKDAHHDDDISTGDSRLDRLATSPATTMDPGI
ncbi:MAG: ABC transporter ATP-binding protein [Acidimicrobiia bacterium]|nr:ABC transporter ATP-binding protein [Acidimicrobiia bacterium]MDH5504273.1 ABC transporter ATP-binding protein [Acidimicrobiia bacterium]